MIIEVRRTLNPSREKREKMEHASEACIGIRERCSSMVWIGLLNTFHGGGRSCSYNSVSVWPSVICKSKSLTN